MTTPSEQVCAMCHGTRLTSTGEACPDCPDVPFRGTRSEQEARLAEPPRVVVWFSCGAASAVAAKLAVEKYGPVRTAVVYCDTMASEHPDNQRFFDDVERWIGRRIHRIRSEKYTTVDEVFEKRRYMSGIAGAPCTVEMKKVPRFEFQRADDVHIFGLTSDERRRIERFSQENFDLSLEWLLRDAGITKDRCLEIVEEAGIALPVMYGLGYKNNNCLGCVKATSTKYWNAIRRDFPEVFELRAKQSREIGARLTRVHGQRIFLDELPLDSDDGVLENISCGPDCAPVSDAAILASREVEADAQLAELEAAALWFMERANEWLHDPAGQRFDPRHITHVCALFERAMQSAPIAAPAAPPFHMGSGTASYNGPMPTTWNAAPAAPAEGGEA